jgi:hypothetical protein
VERKGVVEQQERAAASSVQDIGVETAEKA